MGAISTFLRVTLTSAPPTSSPTLTQLGILDTTPGKSKTVRDQLSVYNSANSLAANYDPSEIPFQMGSTVFAQGSTLNRPDRINIFNGTRTDYRIAKFSLGSQASNNALSVVSDKYGDIGDRVRFQLVDGGNTQLFKVAGSSSVLQEGNTNNNNAIDFTQTAPLEQVVRITLLDPQKPNKTLSIRTINKLGLVPTSKNGFQTAQGVFDHEIEISLATDFTETVITTAKDIVDALTLANDPAYDVTAAGLIDAANTSGSNGSGVALAQASTLIPIDLRFQLKTDASGNSIMKAFELRDQVNADVISAPLLLVSDEGVSNGLGTLTTSAVNETQTLSISGTPTGGTFTFSFGGQTTVAIAYNATSTTIQSALEALSTVGTGNVFVTGGPATVADVIIEFVGGLGGDNVALLTTTDSFTGGTAPASAVAETVAGVSDYHSLTRIGSSLDEVQTVTINGSPTGGTFTLSFVGQTTSSIAYNAPAATVQSALESLSSIKTGNVAVTGSAGGPYTVTFGSALGFVDVALMTADASLLTGGSSPTVVVAELVKGVFDTSSATPLELTRMALAANNDANKKKIEKPYFWVTTGVEDVVGDTSQLSLFYATQRAIFITTNQTGETALQISQRINNLASDRTGFIAQDVSGPRPDAALAGLMKALTQAFVAGGNGAFSPFYGQLNTVPPSTWNDTDKAILFGQAPGAPGAILYVEDFDDAPGTFFVAGSWSTSGNFLDRRWKFDYMVLKMTLRLFSAIRASAGGVAYDNEGIAYLEGEVQEQLSQFTRRRLIAALDKGRTKGVWRTIFPTIESGLIDPIDFGRRTYKASVQFQEAGVIEQVDLVMQNGFFATQFAS